MRSLGTAVQNKKKKSQEEMSREKIAFESNKRELNELMETATQLYFKS